MGNLNDFDGYNEAHSLLETGIHNSNVCSGDEKRDRANRLIADLRRAEAILKRYGLDDRWCAKHKKPKLRVITKDFLISDFKFDETILKEKTPWLYEPFLRREEALVKREKSDKVLIEKGISYALFMAHVDPKVKMITDCVQQTIWNAYKGDLQGFSKDDVGVVMKEKLGEVEICFLSFTDDDFRKWIGRKMSGREIKELFKKATGIQIIAEDIPIFYEDGKWVKIHQLGLNLFQMWSIKEEGLCSRRTNIPIESKTKWRYSFQLMPALEIIMISNLARRQGRLLPRKLYSEVSYRAQEIYRYYKLFEGSREGVNITYKMLSSWGSMGSERNVQLFLGKIRRYLNELVKIGLIRWNPEEDEHGRGKKTWFTLRKP
jgi:hypothetical protein